MVDYPVLDCHIHLRDPATFGSRWAMAAEPEQLPSSILAIPPSVSGGASQVGNPRVIQPIILAAGRGTRMHPSRPKVLHEVGGRPMLGWVLEAASSVAGCHPPLVVVGHGASEIRSRLGAQYRDVLQTEISGTASAVKACLPCLAPDTQALLILYGDKPLVRSASLGRIVKVFLEQGPTLALFTTTIPDYEDWRAPFLHSGRIIRRSDGAIEKVVEYKDATAGERAVLEVNSGTYCVQLGWLKSSLSRIGPSPTTGEYYLTDIVDLARIDGISIAAIPLPPEEAMGLNTRDDIDRAESLLAGLPAS